MSYRAPIKDMRFTLETVGGLEQWTAYPGFEEASGDLVDAVLEEAAKLTADVIAPTNMIGDQEGATLTDDGVVTPQAFKAMHSAFVEGGWPSLGFDPTYGGQGLPGVLAMAVSEMLTSANMAYSLNAMLTSGAIEAIHAHGSEDQKQAYLPKMISGEWSGAMNLTEPQAGSDVGALKAKAVPQADGSYLITGQKIYITWGDHDLQDNVIHLVLARLPDAPEGTRGISMFIVPKFLLNDDGTPGARNDVRCVGLEHKLGIHASPTCVMAFGEEGRCVGYLVGEENKGMRNMFTMMNHARVSVGLEGTAIAERAYQMALAHASERVQSAAIDTKGGAPVAILQHPDVRRMLLTVRAWTEASRAIIYRNAWAIDRAHKAEDAEERAAAQGEADLLTPISKAWATDMGVKAASTALQVFGGMGFVEETGIAQLYRDVRIAPIYEGTNGIQALDLAGRKLHQDGGAHWRALIAEMRDFASEQGDHPVDSASLLHAVDRLQHVAETLQGQSAQAILDTASAASLYLEMFGTIVGAYLLQKQAHSAQARIAAGDGDKAFLEAKIITARFFTEQLLPSAVALEAPILAGGAQIMAMRAEQFARA